MPCAAWLTIIVGFVVMSFGCSTGRPTLTGFAPTDGGPLYFERAGRGPTVVLIHGGMMDHRMWDEQFDLLASSFDVVRYDVRGFGRSPAPHGPYTNYKELGQLLDHLGVARADLIGLSMGGSIAIDFAIADPARVGRLVLVGPGLSGFQWSFSDAEWLPILKAATDKDERTLADLWLKHPFMSPAARSAAAPRIRAIVEENRTAWLMNAQFERELDPMAIGRLGELRAPILLVIGDRDVPDIHKIGDQIKREAAGVREVTIAGAGHIVNMERPAEFNAAILTFLRAR